MLNDVTTTYNNDGNDEGTGGLLIDWNDDNDDCGVELDFNDEINKNDSRTQRVIWHGMVGTYNFFPSLYSQWGYGYDKLE